MFKWDGVNQCTMSGEETTGQLRVQEYLDDVSELDIPSSQTQWYNIDVASLLTSTKIIGHEVDKCTGNSLPVSYTHLTLPTNREV